MGYNPTTYNDLEDELEKGGPAKSTIYWANSLEEQNAAEVESFVDLKLGSSSEVGDQVLSDSFKDHHRACLMDQPFSSTAGSSKRARTPSSGGQAVSCLVDGCKSDLSNCRDYHRRHKVCEMHSKTPRVTIGGHEQRFCQQCSRFHSLGEFDEGKRSCRKRLEGHNRRRRKPQPESLPVNHANFLSANHGSRFLPNSNKQINPASSVVSTAWSGAAKSESNLAPYSNSASDSYSQAYKAKQFPFLQGPDSPLTGTSSAGQTCHQNPNWSSRTGGGSSSSSNNSGQNMFCTGLSQVMDSDRALSLLSSTSAETPQIGSGRVMHLSPINPAQPMVSTGLHYNTIGQYSGPKAQGLEGQHSLCQDVFQGGSDGSSASGGQQTLYFSWE